MVCISPISSTTLDPLAREVAVDLHARLFNLLHGVRRAHRVATDARQLGDDQDVERPPRH
jgi:hypothetical protein